MAGFLYKGILLQQQKEPALSRELREFFNADTISVQMDRDQVSKPDVLTPAGIIDIARQANIIDERDGKLLAEKLTACRKYKCSLLVGDAVDDEPYISSQINPLLKNQRLAAEGLKFAQRAIKAEEACFAVYKNLTDLEIKIPKTILEFPVKRIRGRYPAEYQAASQYPADSVLIGVGALLHLARAIFFNKPQTTAFVTVAGNCIGNPTNLEVSLGMTIAQVLERCGLIDDPGRVIIGGSMTGISLIDTENTLITPTTRAVLAFKEDFKEQHFSCIGCSRCVQVCPKGLNPNALYHSIQYKRYDIFRTLDAQMCIGCNTCSYMCPAKLNLSEVIRTGAQDFRRMSGSMRAASVSAAKQEQQTLDEYMQTYCVDKAERKRKREEFYAICRAHWEQLRSRWQSLPDQAQRNAETPAPENLAASINEASAHIDAVTSQAEETADALVHAVNQASDPTQLADQAASVQVQEDSSEQSPPPLTEDTSQSSTACSVQQDEQPEVYRQQDTDQPCADTEDALHGWRKNNAAPQKKKGRRKK